VFQNDGVGLALQATQRRLKVTGWYEDAEKREIRIAGFSFRRESVQVLVARRSREKKTFGYLRKIQHGDSGGGASRIRTPYGHLLSNPSNA
jgi:hypothetical protein